jgi:hypothetical protein
VAWQNQTVPKPLIFGTSSPGFATTGRRTINPP